MNKYQKKANLERFKYKAQHSCKYFVDISDRIAIHTIAIMFTYNDQDKRYYLNILNKNFVTKIELFLLINAKAYIVVAPNLNIKIVKYVDNQLNIEDGY